MIGLSRVITKNLKVMFFFLLVGETTINAIEETTNLKSQKVYMNK